MTWALILAGARQIVRDSNSVRNGGWQMSICRELDGKVLGVLGLGNIGGQVARIALAFGMRVIAWSQNMTPEIAAAGAFLVTKEELFRQADVLVIGRVLHNWDFATKMMLLRKAYDAMPPGGALIVYERLIDDERRVNASGLLSSLQMLLTSPGGFDFTGADCIGWIRETGFRDIRVEPLTANQSMVVGIK